MDNMEKRSILAVDDDPTNLRLLNEILKDDYKVYLAPSGRRALLFLENNIPDLVLLDVAMPEMDGYETIKNMKADPRLKDIPVVFLTGQEGREKEQEAFDLGAVDYILKPIAAGIVRSRVNLHVELETYRKNLEGLVKLRTDQLGRTQEVILDIMANMTSIRDNETGAHIKRTSSYVKLLIENLKEQNIPGYQVTDQYANDIIKSARLHDIGKVAVPDNILLKPARLSALEFDMIKQHTVYGAQILDEAMKELGDSASFLKVAREIIISHHEKWNGMGYPYGLKGEEIPLSGRVMAIADVYDALISRRPYKPSYSHEIAMQTIKDEAGNHFDPVLVEVAMNVMPLFLEIAKKHSDDPYCS